MRLTVRLSWLAAGALIASNQLAPRVEAQGRLHQIALTLKAEPRGETFAISTIHDFYRRHGVTFKKRRRTPASKTAAM